MYKMPRKAQFRSSERDDLQESRLLSLESGATAMSGRIDTLESSKADTSDLEALQAVVDNKASQSDVDSLSNSLNDLSSSVNQLDGRVGVLENAGYATTSDVATAKSEAQSYADQKVYKIVDSAPTQLDTLKEIATALNDDGNLATTLLNQIATKADASDVATSLALKADKADLDALDAREAGHENANAEAFNILYGEVLKVEAYAGSGNMLDFSYTGSVHTSNPPPPQEGEGGSGGKP